MGPRLSLPETQYSIPTTPGPVTTSIPLMSLYHPFPLRIDNYCERNRQYDACLQIGEFPSDLISGSKIVILVPLKAALFAGESGVFINAVANKLLSILGQQPDRENGYPEVPAMPGADWVLEKVVNVEKSFYTWLNKDGTRVIVMANPINILYSDMMNIKRLPLTPPEDVIHEIGEVFYSPSPPINCFTGEIEPCAKDESDELNKSEATCSDPFATTMTEKEYEKKKKTATDFFLYAFITIIIIGIVWFGITFAMGSGSTMMKSLGDSLGRSFAGGYDAIKKAKLPAMPAMPAMPNLPESVKTTRGIIGNVLGIGEGSKFPPKRQAPVDKPIDDMFPAIEPSEEIKMNTNPLFKSKDDFAKFQNKTRKNPKQGTIGAIANLPAANMPSGVTVNPIINRRRTQRNKPSSISSVDDINRRKIPMNNALRKISANSQAKKGSFQNIVRRAQSVDEIDKLSNQGSVMQELNDLENNLNKEKRQLRKNLLKKSSVVNAFNTTKKSQPEPGAGTGLLPSPAPAPAPARRRKIMQEEEDEDEPPKNERDDEYDPTKLFGSKFLRKSYGFNNGGNKKHRKTGRKI